MYQGRPYLNSLIKVKLPFPRQEHFQIFPTSLTKENMCASIRFGVSDGPEKLFLLSAWRRELNGPGPWFYIIWQTWIYTWNLPVCNSGQYICVGLYRFTKLFLCSSRSDSENQFLFSENSFSEKIASCWLLTLYDAIFSDENKQPSLEWCRL